MMLEMRRVVFEDQTNDNKGTAGKRFAKKLKKQAETCLK